MTFKRIGTKLLIAFFLVAACPALILSVVSYRTNREALEEQISSGMKALSNERARNIEQIFRLKQERAVQIAGSPDVRQLGPDGNNDPSVIKAIQDEIEWTYFEIKLKSLDPDTANITEEFDICDIEGVIIASTNAEAINDFTPPYYLEKAKQAGSYFVGVTKSSRTGEHLITFLEHIQDVQNRAFAGFVVLKVNVKILDDIVTAASGLGKTEEGYIVDKNFSILTKLKKVKKEEIAKAEGKGEAEDKSEDHKLSNPPKAIVDCFRNEEKTAIYSNYAGEIVLGTTKYLANEDWCLVNEVELTEALAPVDKLRQRIIILSGILIVGALVLAFLVSRSLSKPILTVRKAALEIAEGNPTVRAYVSSQDEIGELAGAFNMMTDKLVASQNELARSNQDLEEFSYVASHDLQEPLRKIKAYGDILNEDYAEKLGDDGKQAIEAMQNASGRMMQLIEALLEYSRVTRKVNPPEPIELNKLVSEVLSDLETAIDRSNGKVKVGSLPTINADPIQMRQLFQNLIGNALKFSREGVPPVVKVAAQVLESNNVKITVSDNGIGFDQKFVDKVFQPFQRLVTREQYKGTGIGLSVCKKIVERHNGTISVNSKPDEGTTFTIILPMAS